MEILKTTEQFDQIEKKAIQISGAEAVVRCLLEEDVNIIYGYRGELSCLCMMNYTSFRINYIMSW